MQYEAEGIVFTCDVDIDEGEALEYVKRAQKNFFKSPVRINAHVDNDEIELTYDFDEAPKFQRIRRITGYLVGTLDRFNDGKRAEESERVKHKI